MTLILGLILLAYVLTIGHLIYGFDQKLILPSLFLFEMKAEIYLIF